MRFKCFFCQNEQVPGYQEFETLKKFLSDRGKILARDKSGVCAKHQRLLAREIKRARHLALLPFVS
ncbi:MAG: 30S ribosomal protein S18 [Patescibacteria group bacterium]|nr:30S ribosomal protein S18 [Patescibacteria group bacterium]MDZ4229245.1 30S ribosomal protein S18 [Patescibacteria group bacterium]